MSCKSRIRSWPEKRKEAEPHRCRDQLPKRLVMQSHGITLSFHREMADSSRELVGLAFAHLLEKLGKGWPVFSCAFRLRPLVGSNGWQYLNLQPVERQVRPPCHEVLPEVPLPVAGSVLVERQCFEQGITNAHCEATL